MLFSSEQLVDLLFEITDSISANHFTFFKLIYKVTNICLIHIYNISLLNFKNDLLEQTIIYKLKHFVYIFNLIFINQIIRLKY